MLIALLGLTRTDATGLREAPADRIDHVAVSAQTGERRVRRELQAGGECRVALVAGNAAHLGASFHDSMVDARAVAGVRGSDLGSAVELPASPSAPPAVRVLRAWAGP